MANSAGFNSLSKIGFGCMGITAFYGEPIPDADAMKLMKTVYDANCRHFDTAEIYRAGATAFTANPGADTQWNEVIVGKFVQTVPRESIQVATKFPPQLYGDTITEEMILGAIDRSLARLGLSYIDLYYCHRMPNTLDGLLVFMKAAKKAHSQGKIKFVGLSEVSPAWLKAAHGIHPVAAVQQEWSLLTRNLEESLVPCCKELGVTIVAYSPLARNLLANLDQSEPPKDWRATNPRYSAENFQKNRELAQKVAAMAAQKNVSAAELSLGWLYHQADKMGVCMVPIPGTTKEAHALSNIKGSSVSLSPEDMEVLGQLASAVAGARGNEQYLERALEGVQTR